MAAVAATATVAGICGGVLVLADAGVLAGRKATHNYRSPWATSDIEQFVAHLFADALVESDRSVGVVTDNGIITALPNATAEFTVACCTAVGVGTDIPSELLVRHLRGEFVPVLFDAGS